MRTQAREAAVVVGVSAYMGAVAAYLRLRGRLRPARTLSELLAEHGRLTLARHARRAHGLLAGSVPGWRSAGVLTEVSPGPGQAYLARLPWGASLISDRAAPHASTLILYEDGLPLGPAHSPHAEIAAQGAGRYSHWGAWLYFSSSDGSDPRRNGRRYTWAIAAP